MATLDTEQAGPPDPPAAAAPADTAAAPADDTSAGAAAASTVDAPAPDAPGDTPDASSPAPAGSAPARTRGGTGRGGRWWDLAAVAGFVGVALYLTHQLWQHLSGAGSTNVPDQSFFEWMLAHGARVVAHLEYPFVSSRMNVPDGVNLMANTSILGLSVPLAPVTLLFGPHVTFTALLTAAFTATGIAWYYVLSRHLVTSRAAALVGAAFCAFAPGMVSHGNGHPNIVAQFLVPFIIWRTLRLREPGREIRNGVVLGLLVTWQAFINEEILLLTALGLGAFILIVGPVRRDFWRQARSFLAGLAAAAALAGALLAYPLAVQFFGPGSYHGLSGSIKSFGANLAAYPAFSRLSLAGSAEEVRGLTQNPTEENSFLGWPLLILLGVLILWLVWRSVAALALAVVGVLFAAASLGPEIRWHGERWSSGPWAQLQRLPVFDTVVPTRFALATAPVVGLLLALAWDHWRRQVTTPARTVTGSGLRYASYLLPVAFLAALLPLVPRPLPVQGRTPAPALITGGQLDRYLTGDRSVLFVPTPRNVYATVLPLSWAAQVDLKFSISHGYFLGPARNPQNPADRHAVLTSWPTPTDMILNRVWETGRLPRFTEQMHQQAVRDMRRWQTAVVVQVPERNAEAVRRATTTLVGVQPQWVGGAWVWDVRQVVG